MSLVLEIPSQLAPGTFLISYTFKATGLWVNAYSESLASVASDFILNILVKITSFKGNESGKSLLPSTVWKGNIGLWEALGRQGLLLGNQAQGLGTQEPFKICGHYHRLEPEMLTAGEYPQLLKGNQKGKEKEIGERQVGREGDREREGI